MPNHPFPDAEPVWDVLPIGHHVSAEQRAWALRQVNSPATALMVVSILGGVLNLALIGFNFLLLTSDLRENLEPQAGVAVEVRILFRTAVEVLSFSACAIILAGSIKLRRLQSLSFCRFSTILAMIPCLTPLVVVGIPIGIWAFVTLNKREVAEAFG